MHHESHGFAAVSALLPNVVRPRGDRGHARCGEDDGHPSSSAEVTTASPWWKHHRAKSRSWPGQVPGWRDDRSVPRSIRRSTMTTSEPEQSPAVPDEDLTDLLNEIRLLLPGTLLLVAFLIGLPFNTGYTRVSKVDNA